MTQQQLFITLDEYVEKLLKEGKRSQHPDFQLLFSVYGKDKITEMAKRILSKEKDDFPPQTQA